MQPGRDEAFVAYLGDLVRRDDRGALAALRRGLGKEPGLAAAMFPYVVPWIGDGSVWDEDAYYHVASLFAWHQGTEWNGPGIRRNLGASFARLALDTGSGSIEGRFVAALDSPRSDLPDHLRHAVGLCRSHDVPVDWLQLLRDIRHWSAENRSVQRAWAREFWRRPEPESNANPTDDIVA
jgi:CRISPR system Cascade subunit CasB